MLQLTQSLRNGTMAIIDVPAPVCKPGYVLVRTHYSAVSVGTESKTVSDARKGLLAKARARKKEVRMVMDMARSSGLRDTYRIVRNKLDAYSPSGYACVGEVLDVGDGVTEFRKGDFVACGGGDAAHAELVCVGRRLCAFVPDGVELRHAALTTIAAIALQGVRQADLRLGETALVIGLGLIGQLTLQFLRAQGCTAMGVDIDDRQVRLAHSVGFPHVWHADQKGLVSLISDLTRGTGVDAVLITAGSSSLWPVNFAGDICRKKGSVVIVGAVPTGFNRKEYYQKELALRMSSSYGPGRYDPQYEEQGVDYPVGYVRWTEQRNMQAYLDLLAAGRLDINPLLTHEFPLTEAKSAYDTILARSEHVVGVLLRMKAADEKAVEELTSSVNIDVDTGEGVVSAVVKPADYIALPEVRVSFIGAGSFAQNMILPQLKGLVAFEAVSTNHGNTAAFIKDKYAFRRAVSEPADILSDENTNAVFIMTRHDTHATFVLSALRAGKDVYVEKPLTLYANEVDDIVHAYTASNSRLMLGFNRRFAPHIQQIKAAYSDDQVKAIHYRINAGMLPVGHWVHNPTVGGGRIIGEVCHFIDLCMYLAASPITSVYAVDTVAGAHRQDTIAVTLRFANGSIACISYFSNGSKQLPKERLEVFCGGSTAVTEDLRELKFYGERIQSTRLKKQDKGHAAAVRAFVAALKSGSSSPIPFNEIIMSTKATFAVIESLQKRQEIRIGTIGRAD